MQLYCLYTGVGNEQKIVQQCEKSIAREKEAIFSPTVERKLKIRGKEETLWRTLYPGYVFVETDKPQDFFLRLRFSLGRTVFGYLQMLRTNEYILPLAADEEAMLRKMMDKDHKVRLSYAYKLIQNKKAADKLREDKGEQEPQDLPAGAAWDPKAKIVITSGPLTSLKGQIIRINPHKKIAVVRTKLLGEPRDVVVGLELIGMAGTKKPSVHHSADS